MPGQGSTRRAVAARLAAVALLLGAASACAGPAVPPGRAGSGRSALPTSGDAVSTDGGADALAPASLADPATPAAPAGDAPEADGTTAVFATGPRSAPATGPGTALLRDVRVGVHPTEPGTAGYERIVLELSGPARPGYRVRWLEGSTQPRSTTAGSAAVAGEAHLEIVVTPASGVDPVDGALAYAGPDRVPVADGAAVLRDLVRTGDYAGVLTWVVGATGLRPFRVLTLEQPPRLVIDLQAG